MTKNKKKYRWIFLLILIIMFSFHLPLYAGELPVRVFVSILPQAYFVEKIGGERVTVDVFVLPGKSPATYAPSPAQMSSLANASIYFRVGLPFENAFIPKIKSSINNLKIVDTRKDVPIRQMESHMETMEDDHGHHDHEGHDHHHEGGDPHIWLSPPLVKIQAKTITDALCETDPEGSAYYRKNYQAFLAELDQLHLKIQNALEKIKGESIFVFHPSYGYFTDTYGLTQIAVEMEGKAPKGKQLAFLISEAKEKNVRVIFVQPQFDRSIAQKIANAIDGVVVMLDPLSKDYANNLLDMSQKISEALTK